VSLWVGRPLVMRFGKYLLMTPRKVELAEAWAARDGLKGVFIARLLPVLRHLISIPAGILRMPFLTFTIVTTLGAGLWCLILAWWGQQVLGEQPGLMDDPNALIAVVKDKMIWFAGGVVVFGVLLFVALRKRKPVAPPVV
jgi:membrane protein DedA with SNARE-associated domain